jgi:hypothetical protein
MLDTARGADTLDKGHYAQERVPGIRAIALPSRALVKRVDDRRDNTASHPVAGEKLNRESLQEKKDGQISEAHPEPAGCASRRMPARWQEQIPSRAWVWDAAHVPIPGRCVPDPLRQNGPELQAPRGVRTPAGSHLFLVFIGENGLERSSMQGESHDISRSDPFVWQGCGEQFVDHLAPRGADASSSGGRWMRGDDDWCVRCGRGEMQIRAIKECPPSPRGADGSEAFPVARRDGPAPGGDRGDRRPCLPSRRPIQLNLRQWLHGHLSLTFALPPG